MEDKIYGGQMINASRWTFTGSGDFHTANHIRLRGLSGIIGYAVGVRYRSCAQGFCSAGGDIRHLLTAAWLL